MTTKNQPPSQVDKFREAARELETDDREEAFDAKLKRIAKAQPAHNGDASPNGPARKSRSETPY